MRRILVVEDEPNLAAGLEMNLSAEGYEVIIAADGNSGLEIFGQIEFDLAILDIMLPGMDGISLCKEIRKTSHIPVIFLTARASDKDKIEGLSVGGDDYITKPFNLEELLHRISSVFRRVSWQSADEEKSDIISFKDCQLNMQTFEASGPGGKTVISRKEAQVIKYLYERRGQSVSRDSLLDGVWGYNAFPSTRTVDNFILRLRKIFEKDPSKPTIIKSIRGVGYRFDVSE